MSTPLRHLLQAVLFDQDTRAQLGADPEGFLTGHGWEHLAGPELEEAIAALGDAMPIETARAIEDSCETIDFTGDSLVEVGADLTALVDQVDPELPTSSPVDGAEAVADIDLDFGVGADAEVHVGSADAPDPVDAVLAAGDAGAPADSEWSAEDLIEFDIDEPALEARESFLPDADRADEVDLDVPDEPDLDFEG